MIDALLLSVRDAIRANGQGWDVKTCEVGADHPLGMGLPPPRCGDWFASVCQLDSSSDMLNALDEYFGFAVVVTRRVPGAIPWDRVGDQLVVQQTVRQLAKNSGLNARVEQLRAFLHMNWALLGMANALMMEWTPDLATVNGFCEPAHLVGTPTARPVSGEWFSADGGESIDALGLVVELRFEGARRLQPIATYA